MKDLTTQDVEQLIKEGKTFVYFIYYENGSLVYRLTEKKGVIGVISYPTEDLITPVPPLFEDTKEDTPLKAKEATTINEIKIKTTRVHSPKGSNIVISDEKLALKFLNKDKLASTLIKCIKATMVKENGHILSQNKVLPTSNLFNDLGFDSLDCVDLTIKLEKEIGIKIPDSVADILFARTAKATVEDITENLHQKLQTALS